MTRVQFRVVHTLSSCQLNVLVHQNGAASLRRIIYRYARLMNYLVGMVPDGYRDRWHRVGGIAVGYRFASKTFQMHWLALFDHSSCTVN